MTIQVTIKHTTPIAEAGVPSILVSQVYDAGGAPTQTVEVKSGGQAVLYVWPCTHIEVREGNPPRRQRVIVLLLAVWLSGAHVNTVYTRMPDVNTCIVARNQMRAQFPAVTFECGEVAIKDET